MKSLCPFRVLPVASQRAATVPILLFACALPVSAQKWKGSGFGASTMNPIGGYWAVPGCWAPGKPASNAATALEFRSGTTDYISINDAGNVFDLNRIDFTKGVGNGTIRLEAWNFSRLRFQNIPIPAGVVAANIRLTNINLDGTAAKRPLQVDIVSGIEIPDGVELYIDVHGQALKELNLIQESENPMIPHPKLIGDGSLVIEGDRFTHVNLDGPSAGYYAGAITLKGGTLSLAYEDPLGTGKLTIKGGHVRPFKNKGPITLSLPVTVDGDAEYCGPPGGDVGLTLTDEVTIAKSSAFAVGSSDGGGPLNGVNGLVFKGSIKEAVEGSKFDITKKGTGHMTIDATAIAMLSGPISVAEGQLIVNGRIGSLLKPVGKVTVKEGAKLQGTGTIFSNEGPGGLIPADFNFVNTAKLRGGNLKGPGVLHLEGNVLLEPGAFLLADLDGEVPGTGAPGSGHGRIEVSNGAVHLDGAILVSTLNYVPQLAWTPSSPLPEGPPLRLLDNQGPGPIVGTLLWSPDAQQTPAALPDGAMIVLESSVDRKPYKFLVNYQGGDGNDLELRNVPFF